MRTFLRITLVWVFIGLALSAQAQYLKNNPQLQERLTQAKLREIQRALQLSDSKLNDLAPIYRRYEKELNELSPGRAGLLLRANPDSLSAEEADRIITAQLERAVKMSTIRRKFYPEFKTVLSPQQVIKMYQSEAQLRRRVLTELRKRFGRELQVNEEE